MKAKLRAKRILEILRKNYPDARMSSNFSNNFELLIAVMLSAQTTDKQVNKVAPRLFKKYETVKEFANADIKSLEKDIKSIGLYKTKAKNVKRTAQIILRKHNGKVPNSMIGLLELPGIGRKTANIVLSHAFNKSEGIAVDTHVKRLAYNFGLTKEKNPLKIERDLMKLFDRKDWMEITHLFIAHGRKKDKEVDLLLKKIKV
ncbi:MAG TPA: endonuclease III [Patescibacteria group bacterium]|nr:endonuclease III [Patescibacteria group bacterium]